MEIRCANCQQKLRVADELLGTKVNCPRCKALILTSALDVAKPALKPTSSIKAEPPAPQPSDDYEVVDDDKQPAGAAPASSKQNKSSGDYDVVDDDENPADSLRRRSPPKTRGRPQQSYFQKNRRDLLPLAIAVIVGLLFVFPSFVFPKFALLAMLVGPGISLFAFGKACEIAGKKGNYVSFDYLEFLGPLRYLLMIGFLGLYALGYVFLWCIVLIRFTVDRPRMMLPWAGLSIYGGFVVIAALTLGAIGDKWGPNRFRPPNIPTANVGMRNDFSRPNFPAPNDEARPAPRADLDPPVEKTQSKPPVEQPKPPVVQPKPPIERPKPPVEEPKPVEATKFTGDAVIDAALNDLESSKMQRQRQAAQALANMKPKEEHRAVVAQKLADAGLPNDRFVRRAHVKALCVWATEKEIPTLIAYLDHEDRGVRAEVLKSIGKLRDERIIAPVIRCLVGNENRRDAAQALRDSGPIAEKDLLPLAAPNPRGAVFLRVEIVKILGDIGTEKSVPVLQAVIFENNIFLAKEARLSLFAIHSRSRKK